MNKAEETSEVITWIEQKRITLLPLRMKIRALLNDSWRGEGNYSTRTFDSFPRDAPEDEHLFYKANPDATNFEHRDIVEVEVGGVIVRFVKKN